MRIVQVVYWLAAGGAEVFAVDLAVELKRRGVDSSVITLCAPGDSVGRDLSAKLAQANVPDCCLGKAVGKGQLRCIAKFTAAIARLRPDCVHSHTSLPTWINGCFTRTVAPSAACVCTLHSVAERFRRTFPASIIRPWERFRSVVCVSEAVMRATEDVPRKLVVPVARDLSHFAAKPLARVLDLRSTLADGDEVVLLHVGSMRDGAKNHLAMLRGFSLALPECRSKLVMVGDGILRPQLESEAARLGISKQVVFAGVQPNTADYYHAADLFLLPSVWEGRPVAGMEAFASGLPCVFSPIDPLRELAHGYPGVVFTEGTEPAEIAAGVCRAIRELAYRRWRRTAGERCEIASRMGISRCVDDHLAVGAYPPLEGGKSSSGGSCAT